VDGCDDRVFRSFGGVRAILRSDEVGGFHGRTVCRNADRERAGNALSVLRAVASGEILKRKF
jgi:hypothetical protein